MPKPTPRYMQVVTGLFIDPAAVVSVQAVERALCWAVEIEMATGTRHELTLRDTRAKAIEACEELVDSLNEARGAEMPEVETVGEDW